MTNIRVDDKDLIAVQCSGCEMFYLGNTGLDSDPVKDCTYQDTEEGKLFICTLCWESKEIRRLN